MNRYSAIVRIVILCAFVSPVVCLTHATEPKEDGASQSVGNVEHLLAEESKGISVDRSQLAKLRDVTEFARWQAGMLQRDGDWVSIDQFSEDDTSPSMREYIKRRSAEKLDADGHRKLARWCSDHGLNAQAVAHWNAILDLLPNDLEARRTLGYKFVAGGWYSPSQLAKADRISKAYLSGLREWLPECQKISRMLANDAEDKAKALNRLREINKEEAIPALELTALQVTDATAAPWILAIAKNRSTPACLALTRIALSEPDARTKLATSKLKEYPRDLYIPELLGLLATPIETKVRYGTNELGELTVYRALFRTTNSEKQLVELERLVRVNNPMQSQLNLLGIVSRQGGTRRVTGIPTVASKSQSNVDTNVDEQAAAKLAIEDQALLEREIDEANRQNELLAKRVYKVLRDTTGEELEDSPQAWWEWWRRSNYRSSAEKPFNRKRYQQVDKASLTLSEVRYVQDIVVSCLVAGTTVQTSSGLVPIESIQVGDLVLAQDVESGKLDLKPVVRTTLRKPETIYCIHTASGDIRATGGHRWWVAGKGWTMSVQLEPEMIFHNAKGTTKILSIEEEAEPLPTHNLVVDDFHTYFVGPDRVLSFDNVDPIPTLRKVPGY